ALRRTLLKMGGAGPLTDGELLDRFAAQQDQAAFEEIVRRHGLMVLRVCWRAVRHGQGAEDAFQATFIVLGRRAAAVAKMASVGGWLHGVAYRTAQNANKIRAGRIHAREKPLEEERNALAAETATPLDMDGEVRAVLDEELSRLPERYRVPLVLC